MKTKAYKLILLVLLLPLAGFSTFGKTPAGGAAYMVEFHDSGNIKKATANVLNESDSVELSIKVDPDDPKKRIFTFKKEGTSGAKVMGESLRAQQQMLDRLINLVPVPVLLKPPQAEK